MRNSQNEPIGAELRGTGRHVWRGLARGSQKDSGFFAVKPKSYSSIVLCESAIDAISCFILNPTFCCISTSGARHKPSWLPNIIASNLNVYCAFDADSTGDTMANAMIANYPSIQRLRPSAHDWNDLLKSQ